MPDNKKPVAAVEDYFDDLRKIKASGGAAPPRLGSVATHQSAPGCAGAHTLHRGGVDCKIIPGGKPGYQSTLGRGRADASHSRAA